MKTKGTGKQKVSVGADNAEAVPRCKIRIFRIVTHIKIPNSQVSQAQSEVRPKEKFQAGSPAIQWTSIPRCPKG